MANVEETLGEYDVVTGPENARGFSTENSPSLVDEKDKKTDDALDGKTTDDSKAGKKDANSQPHFTESHQNENENLENETDQINTNSNNIPVEVLCPKANCSEKILFCLDFSSEMNETFFRSRAGDKMSAFRETIKALRMFIMNKHRINPNHEYGLTAFQDRAVWVRGFTKAKDILNILDDLDPQECGGDFDLAELFDVMHEKVKLPEVVGDVRVVPPPYIIRVLFVYGRSQRAPLFSDKQVHTGNNPKSPVEELKHVLDELDSSCQVSPHSNNEIHHQLESSPYFFFDVLYVHEPPSEENKCEEIFTGLCELDHKGLSYILEAASLTRLFDCTAMLLAHPLQRPLQPQAHYHIASTPPADDQVFG